ncbi:MAG: Spy/CpxP family protein refolding chaperone [Bacteroidota bacterium]
MKVLVATTMISLVSMSWAMAQPGPGQGGQMRFTDELNLTEQQKKQVDQIRDEAMRQGIDRRAEIAKAQVDLRQLVRAEKPDQSAIDKKLKEIATLRSAAQSHRLNAWFSINKLLTAEQQQVWKKHLERRMEMSGRMGMRDGMSGHMRDRMQGRGMQRFDRPMQRGNQ